MKTSTFSTLGSALIITLACSGCADTNQSSQTPPVRVAAKPTSKPKPKPTLTATPTQAERRRAERKRAKTERQARREQARAEARAIANAAFNVPALLGKEIEQVRAVLGPLEDSGLENDDDGEMSWSNSKGGLLIDYDTLSRNTTEFFVNDEYGSPLPKDRLLAMGNLKENDPRYRVEFVPSPGSSTQYMGVRVTPN